MAGEPAARVRWQLQVYVTSGPDKGIADMVMLVGERPAVVIETKIAAPLRIHASGEPIIPEPSASDSGAVSLMKVRRVFTQLHTYGRWLTAARSGDAWPGALVLLTHLTPAPSDFGLAPTVGDYGSSHQAVCRWRQVWQWARDAGSRTTPHTAALGAELADFLEERGMGGHGLTPEDVTAMGGYFGAVRRIEHTLTDVADSLSEARTEMGMSPPSRIHYTAAMASVWSWSWLEKLPGYRWYVGWGIRFPEHSNRHWTAFQSLLPDVPHLFVTLGTETMIIPLDRLPDRLPEGWVRTAPSEMVTGCRMDSLPSAGEELADAASHWMVCRLAELSPILRELTRLAATDT